RQRAVSMVRIVAAVGQPARRVLQAIAQILRRYLRRRRPLARRSRGRRRLLGGRRPRQRGGHEAHSNAADRHTTHAALPHFIAALVPRSEERYWRRSSRSRSPRRSGPYTGINDCLSIVTWVRFAFR